MIVPSEPQQKKFDLFLQLPNAAELVASCLAVVEAAELDLDEIGTRWGVTVCASNTSSLRLNVGNRVLFDARPDGDMELFIVHPLDKPALWDDHVDVYEGFTQVKDSIRLIAKGFEELCDLLDEPELLPEVKAHADASGRALPRAEWHNPLVTGLLLVEDTGEAWEDEIDLEGDDEFDEDDEDGEDDAEVCEENAAPAGPGPTGSPTSPILTGKMTNLNHQIVELHGSGSTKSRPFDIPPNAEFFALRWKSKDKDTRISVNGVPPTVCYESFEGAEGDGAVYETGRFYAEIDADGEWTVSIEAHFSSNAQPTAGTLATFSGRGAGKTRPFSVPKGSEYFVVKWTTTDKEMDLCVNGIEPTSAYDRFSGGKTGEGLVYESGRFYAEVETEGAWTLEVILE